MEAIRLTVEEIKQAYIDNNVSMKRVKNAQSKFQSIPDKGTFANITFEEFKADDGTINIYPAFIIIDETGEKIGTLPVGRITDQRLKLDDKGEAIPKQVKNDKSKYFNKWFLQSESVNKHITANRSELEIVSYLLGKSFVTKRLPDQKVQKITMSEDKETALHFESTDKKAANVKHIEVKDLYKFELQ